MIARTGKPQLRGVLSDLPIFVAKTMLKQNFITKRKVLRKYECKNRFNLPLSYASLRNQSIKLSVKNKREKMREIKHPKRYKYKPNWGEFSLQPMVLKYIFHIIYCFSMSKSRRWKNTTKTSKMKPLYQQSKVNVSLWGCRWWSLYLVLIRHYANNFVLVLFKAK